MNEVITESRSKKVQFGAEERGGAGIVSFDELLDAACKSAGLPNMARILLPSTLSNSTKKAVMKLKPEVLGKILKSAIDQIDHGSVESVDALVRKALQM